MGVLFVLLRDNVGVLGLHPPLQLGVRVPARSMMLRN